MSFRLSLLMRIKAFERTIAFALLLGVAHLGLAAETAGTIKTLTGTATVLRGEAAIAAYIGQPIFAGDRISTLNASYVGMTLHDDTLLTIGPRSEMEVREFQFNTTTYLGSLAVSFLKGSARVVTGLIGKQSPQRVRFDTPTATIGIRGTDFIVDLEEQE